MIIIALLKKTVMNLPVWLLVHRCSNAFENINAGLVGQSNAKKELVKWCKHAPSQNTHILLYIIAIIDAFIWATILFCAIPYVLLLYVDHWLNWLCTLLLIKLKPHWASLPSAESRLNIAPLQVMLLNISGNIVCLYLPSSPQNILDLIVLVTPYQPVTMAVLILPAVSWCNINKHSADLEQVCTVESCYYKLIMDSLVRNILCSID